MYIISYFDHILLFGRDFVLMDFFLEKYKENKEQEGKRWTFPT